MSLETATFIDQLDSANPPSSDLKSQGDDHLRLIKSVLKNSIKRVTRAFYVPGTVFKVGALSYSVLASDDNMTIVCNTIAGNVTLTLPTLAAGDAGWCVYVQKNTLDANTIFIVPPSGSINGHSKIRRSTEHHITKVVWNGATFEASRPGGPPVGSLIEYYGSTLPNGYLWPDGTTFTAADYVELNTALGGNTKPDKRGRIGAGRDDMGGSAANRLTTAGSGFDGTVLGIAGGAQSITLAESQIPAHTHTASVTDPGHTHTDPAGPSPFGGPTAGGNAWGATGSYTIPSHTTGISVTNSSTGGGLAHNNVQPTIVANFILVAE